VGLGITADGTRGDLPYASPVTMHGRRKTENRAADAQTIANKAAVGAMFGWEDLL